MEVHIRKIEAKDFPSLILLFKEFAAFENLPDKMTNSVEKMEEDQAFLNGFVVEHEGKVVAFTTFFFAYYSWTGKALYMDDLYVTHNFRGNGLGSKLIREVISFAKKERCRKMRWSVSNWNKDAINFYKSLGAEIDEVEWNCHLEI